MREWILAFSLGIISGGLIPVLPEISTILLLFIPVLLACRFPWLRLGAAFCLGLWWVLFQSIQHDKHILPKHLEQEDLWLTGKISGLPQENEFSTRFQFTVTSVCLDQQDCNSSVLPGDKRLVLLNDYSGLKLLPDQHWRLKVRLKRPRGFANPGGFDYEGWLFQEKITGTGYVRADQANQLAGSDPRFSLTRLFNQIRFEFRQRLKDLPLEAKGFLAALTIGDRYFINAKQWELLSLTGTNHLMVISGLHLSLVAWLVYHLACFLARQIPALCLVIPANRLASVIAMVSVFLYGGIAGFSLPVQRAVVMVCCLMTGQILLRQTAPGNSLCLALLLVLVVDPLAPLSKGFWLSFMAVAVLLLTLFRQQAGEHQAVSSGSRGLVRSQLFIFLGLMPLMMLFFQQISLLAPLVNLLAIPFIGMLVVPLCLLSLMPGLVAPPLMVQLISLPDFLLLQFSKTLLILSTHARFLLIPLPALPVALLGLLWLALLVTLLGRHSFSNLAFIPVLVSVMLFRPEKLKTGEFTLDVLDVGQGLAIVVSTREHLLIYDAGPAYSPRFNAGSGVIEPFLRTQNLPDPELLIISHGDNDHAGGYTGLLTRYPETHTIAGEPFPGLDTANFCQAGQRWRWDAIDFEILHPANRPVRGNASSCVLKISTGTTSVLLPGDIEAATELELVRDYREKLQADILIAPHHGSRTSSIMPLIRMVSFDYVIFSTGYLNSFGHPHPLVRSRYDNQQISVLDTADTGHIRFRISHESGASKPEIYRQIRARFWSTP